MQSSVECQPGNTTPGLKKYAASEKGVLKEWEIASRGGGLKRSSRPARSFEVPPPCCQPEEVKARLQRGIVVVPVWENLRPRTGEKRASQEKGELPEQGFISIRREQKSGEKECSFSKGVKYFTKRE